MKRFLLLWILFIVFLTAPLLHAAEATEHSDHGSTLPEILILNSYHPGYAWSDDEQAGVIDVFQAKDKNWLPVIEYLDLKRLPDGRHLAKLKELFRSKYQTKNFSVVIAMDNRALEFAMDNQAELFRNTPIVFCGINNYTPSLLKGHADVTGIAESIDLAGTIEVMLRLHPATREIFVLHDYTASVLAVRKEVEALVPRFGAKVRFSFTDPLTIEELLKKLERLPKNNLVLEIGFITDKSGRAFGMTEAVMHFFEHSPVPVYSPYEQRLGFGIVGGKLLSARIHGANAARIALRVLAGEKASAIPVVFESDSQLMFDYKVMNRFGIPLSALPEGSMVIDKPVSFYAAHRVVIQTALGVIVFMAIVIFLLMINIIQRRRSAIALRASKEALRSEHSQLQAILDYSPALISIKDLKGNVILANRNFAVLDAPPLHEFVGKNVFDLFPRDVAENLWNNDQSALKAGGPVESEEIVKHKDGSWHTYLTLKFPVYKEPGQPFGICAISTDITERKRVAEAFRESEQSCRLLAAYHKRLNDISIAFIEASGTEDLFNRISESFRSLTGAITATFSVYNQETRTLKVVSLSTDPISSGKISSIFGPGLFEMRMPVSADDMEHMLSQGIGRPKDLCELSFGVMPQDISDAVMDAVGCRQIVALAITYAEELFGTCVAYLPGDQPVVPDDALKTYIYLSGLAIKRKQAEEALRESEARYRQVVEHAPAAIFEADLTTGRLLSVNQVLCEYSGYTRDELLALQPLDLMTEESQKLILQRMAGYAAGEPVPPTVEYKGRSKSGREFWISVNAKYFYQADLPVRATVVAHDITERKEAENALRESEERLRFHTDNSPMAVVEWNADFIVTRWTGAAEKMFGWSAEETIGKPIMELRMIYEEDIPIVQSVMQRLTDGKSKNIVSSNRNYTKKREVIHCEWYNSALHDSAGKMISVISQVLDITGRKRAENRLARLNDCFLQFGVSPDDNINRLVAVCGELMNATCALYNRLGKNLLCSVGQWRPPAGFKSEDKPNGHICYDVIQQGMEHPLLVRNLQESPYARTDPNILPYGLQTYLGMVVKWKQAAVGSLCVVYQTDITPSNDDLQFMTIIASAIAVEEDRLRTEEALSRAEENFRRSLDDSPLGVRIVTEEGETIYANRAILDIFGYDSIEELRTTPLKERYTLESYAEFQIRKEKRKRGDYSPSEYEISIVRKDSEVRQLKVFRKKILWDGEGQSQVIYIDITERKRAEEELRASREQMRALAGRLQAVREEERTQIAREIHDELGGALTGLKIDFSLLTRAALKIKNETVRTSLLAGMDSMNQSVDSTIQTVRRIAMELRPGVLDDLGLVAALEWQLKDFEKRTGIRCEFFPPAEELSLDADLSTALFRIFQEALTNVARHSGATEVRVRLRTDADSPALEVQNNGRGIEKEKILSSKSLGLLGMRERAQMFGGRITVTGTPGIGTTVTVEIPPVEKRKMDRDQEGDAG